MKIVLGVTGGISAYKACDIISGLQATGHEVKVIMTESAKRFITEESLAVLSGNAVFTDDNRDINGVVSHIELSSWGDVLVIAPATANTINKINNGFADNFLTTVVMAWDNKPKFLVPAMNPKMWDKVIQVLYGMMDWDVINPVEGRMACGDIGMGKLEKPRRIVELINTKLNNKEGTIK